jgi:hypothetical protein
MHSWDTSRNHFKTLTLELKMKDRTIKEVQCMCMMGICVRGEGNEEMKVRDYT